jgi:hypothetical protein
MTWQKLFVAALVSLTLICTMSTEAVLADQPCKNLVSNGGFEDQPDAKGWQAEPKKDFSTRIEIQRRGIVLPSAEGEAHVELASDAPTKIFQNVQTVPGAQYSLRFAYSARPSFESEARVLWNDEEILTLPAPGDSGSTWHRYSVRVTGTGQDTLAFEDISNREGRQRAGGAFIDEVKLTCVPGCQNLVTNGGFEDRPDATGWRADTGGNGFSNRIEIQRSAIVLPSVEGNAHVELASNGPTKILQDIQTVPDAQYEVSFAYIPRPSYDSRATVYWNDTPLYRLPSPGATASDWHHYSVTVTGSGSDTLGFEDTSDSRGRERAGGAFIDDVRVCRVFGIVERCCCCDCASTR